MSAKSPDNETTELVFVKTYQFK